MNELLTPQEMAERLRVSNSTVMSWARNGLIPSIRITGKVVRFDPDLVLQAIREEGGRPTAFHQSTSRSGGQL